MPLNPHAAAARAEALGRLAAFREARATLHTDIRHAAELGLTQAEIAREAGMSRQWVAQVLAKETSK